LKKKEIQNEFSRLNKDQNSIGLLRNILAVEIESNPLNYHFTNVVEEISIENRNYSDIARDINKANNLSVTASLLKKMENTVLLEDSLLDQLEQNPIKNFSSIQDRIDQFEKELRSFAYSTVIIPLAKQMQSNYSIHDISYELLHKSLKGSFLNFYQDNNYQKNQSYENNQQLKRSEKLIISNLSQENQSLSNDTLITESNFNKVVNRHISMTKQQIFNGIMDQFKDEESLRFYMDLTGSSSKEEIFCSIISSQQDTNTMIRNSMNFSSFWKESMVSGYARMFLLYCSLLRNFESELEEFSLTNKFFLDLISDFKWNSWHLYKIKDKDKLNELYNEKKLLPLLQYNKDRYSISKQIFSNVYRLDFLEEIKQAALSISNNQISEKEKKLLEEIEDIIDILPLLPIIVNDYFQIVSIDMSQKGNMIAGMLRGGQRFSIDPTIRKAKLEIPRLKKDSFKVSIKELAKVKEDLISYSIDNPLLSFLKINLQINMILCDMVYTETTLRLLSSWHAMNYKAYHDGRRISQRKLEDNNLQISSININIIGNETYDKGVELFLKNVTNTHKKLQLHFLLRFFDIFRQKAIIFLSQQNNSDFSSKEKMNLVLSGLRNYEARFKKISERIINSKQLLSDVLQLEVHNLIDDLLASLGQLKNEEFNKGLRSLYEFVNSSWSIDQNLPLQLTLPNSSNNLLSLTYPQPVQEES